MKEFKEIYLELDDGEWDFSEVTHHRQVVRAIVYDQLGYYYFVRADRDDDFGRAVVIETSGGGVEDGEELEQAIKRELREELGADVDIICKIGVVSDYYNLIKRHNINSFYLCCVRELGERMLTADEIERFHLTTLRLTYDEAIREYENNLNSRLGRLIRNRELPILIRAKEIIDERGM